MEKSFAEKMKALVDAPEPRYRPDLRWWLAEGLNTDETLKKNVQEIYDSGFGAAEFLAMPEPSADSAIYGWGSAEWTSDTRLIVEETTRHGLGFSLTSGAHWANANLPDTYTWQGEPYTPDNKAAAKELDYATVLLRPGEVFDGPLPLPPKVASLDDDLHGTAASYTRHEFQGVVAARLVAPRAESGQDHGHAQGTGKLALASLTDLTDAVAGEGEARSLRWTAPADGEWALFAYWMHGTGQTASPSVSTNYTINYVDAYGVQALIDYWEEIVLTDDLRATIKRNGRGEIYMDSLELLTFGAGGVYWGHHLQEEFRRRMGYDLMRYVPLLTMDGVRVNSRNAKQYDYQPADDADMATAGKVRNDFYSVLSELYLENVLRPLQAWLHGLGMTLRAEPSYGMPYEISTPAKYIDGIETESFAQVADLDLFRGQFGSANMYGRTFSSETGAVHKRNYYYNMDQWTQLCYLQFAGGVSRTVFHGYSAIEGSEGDTYWPGHEGMYARFSERFNSRQPAAPHYPGWTRMLARNQKLLRQGVPRRDIAILRTDYFFINYGQPEGENTFADSPFMRDKPSFWRDLSLQRAGYTYDYFSPLLLLDEDNARCSGGVLQPTGPAYKAVILYQEGLELAAAKKLLEMAEGGLPVLFVNNNPELLAYDGTEIRHGKAASASRSLADSDEDLQAVVAKLKALPNVAEADSPADALAALERLGVRPRVAYGAPNSRVMTVSRHDAEAGVFTTFVYAYKFELEKDAGPFTFTLRLEGEGAPWHVDDWTGAVRPLALYDVKDDRTELPLTLVPGEARLIVLDLKDRGGLHALSTTAAAVTATESGALAAVAAHSGEFETALSSGSTVATVAKVPAAIPLAKWDITVEDWNEGERVVNTEEKFGHVTREVYYTTKKTQLEFKDSPLLPWKDLPATAAQLATLAGNAPAMDQVSGLGSYTTSFELPADWGPQNGACLEIESAGGGSVALWVNGQKAPGVNIRTLRADISALVKPGHNDIRIEVASTLTNRMRQRGYQHKASGWTDTEPAVQAYGLAGSVQVVPYTLMLLE